MSDAPTLAGAYTVLLNQRSATAPYHREVVEIQGDEVPGKAIGFDPQGRLVPIPVGREEFVVTDPRWGFVPGSSDIGPAANAAITAMPANGGQLVIPAGSWTTSQRIIFRSGIRISGAGRHNTRIVGSVAGVFGWSSNIHSVTIENLNASSSLGHLITCVGGDFFLSMTTIRGCWLEVSNPNASILHHDTAQGVVMLLMEDTRLDRPVTATVPGIYLRDSIGGTNSNTFRNLWAQSYYNTTTPFFYIESTNFQSFAYDNVFKNIIGEQNLGGLIELRNNFGAIIENVVDWDSGDLTYTKDLIKIGKSLHASANPLTRSCFVLIKNAGRRGGGITSGCYDINLVPTECIFCTVEAACHASHTQVKINFDHADLHVVASMSTAAGLWTGKANGVSSYHGGIVQCKDGLIVGKYDTRWTSGDVAPNGVVTAEPGSLYTLVGGGAGATLWVKESGWTTNTGWVAK